LALSPFNKALCELFIGAFFFTMHSCKYIQVIGPRQTKLLCIKNINFYKKRKKLNHSDPSLHQADCISITFKLQKKDSKGDIITQYRSPDKLLCPGKIWSGVIRRIIN